MKHSIIAVLMTLALATVSSASPRQKSSVTIRGFTFDLSALGSPPPAQLPANTPPPQSLSPAVITSALLQTQEAFSLTQVIGLREFYESPSWYLEISSDTGSVFALRKPQVVVPQPQDPSVLQADSLQRLGALGIGQEQFLKVLQRRLMMQGEQNGQVTPPAIFHHKTFVLRGVNGVEIQGHRAVVTHNRDGSLQRVFLNWPALAASGHKLHTDVSRPFIIGSTFRSLLMLGETGGAVRLRWKYVPKLLPSGEVELVLMVGARLQGPDDVETGAEPRELDINVLAY